MFHSDSVPTSSVSARVSTSHMAVTRRREQKSKQTPSTSTVTPTLDVASLIAHAVTIASGLDVDVQLLKIQPRDFHARIPLKSSIPLRISREDKPDVAAQLKLVFETLEMPLQIVPEPTQELQVEVRELADIARLSHGFEAQVAGTDLRIHGWCMLHIPSSKREVTAVEKDTLSGEINGSEIRVTDTSGLAQLFVGSQEADVQSLHAIANNIDRRL